MKKILLADDVLIAGSDSGKEILKAAKGAGLEIDFVETAEKAIKLLQNPANEYDLVLMDGQFSKSRLQGLDAISKIRSFSMVPIVMISISPFTNKKGVARGADDFVLKCSIVEDLINKNGTIGKTLQIAKDRVLSRIPTGPSTEDLVSSILQMFLPLDIDMQALDTLLQQEETEKIRDHLKEMRKHKVNYTRKLTDLRFLVTGESVHAAGASREAKKLLGKGIPLAEREGADKDQLKELAGIPNNQVPIFFLKLMRGSIDGNAILKHNWAITGVTSFHQWYQKLADTIKKVK